MRTILKFNLLNTKKDLWFRLMVVPFVGLISPLLTDVVPDGDAWGVGGEDETSDIARTGRVGIGFNGSPTQRLHVIGNGQIGDINSGMRIGNISHSGWAGIAHEGSATATNYALRQNANGQTHINAATNQPIYFNINNVEQARLHLNGRFGLGVTNPTQELHVVGGARITSVPSTNGNATSDRVVIADGSGNLRSLPASSFGSSGPSIAAAAKISSGGAVTGHNVASATRVNNQYYQVNFTTAMANANYIIQLTVLDQAGNRNDAPIITYGTQTTTGFRVYIGDSDNGESDLFDYASEFMLSVITF